MASKNDIKQAVYSDLQSAVSGLVDSENVVLANPEKRESLPAVVYEEFSREAPYRGATTRRVADSTDSNGNTIQVYHEYMQLRFDVYPLAEGESTKDELYELIRRQFNSYSMWQQPEDLHSDVKNVSVTGGTDADMVSDDDVVRADRMTIEVIFFRVQTRQA